MAEEDEGFVFGLSLYDIIRWIWSLLPFEVKSYVWMCILTALGVILLILCCCTICFCTPPCICAVWLEKRRRRRNKDRRELAFVTERQNQVEPCRQVWYLQQPSAPPLLV